MAKRFYTNVTTDQDTDGHFIRLDGRELKTPGKRPIRVPSAEIAQQIREEWDAVPQPVDGDIDPMAMPVTRLANVANEGVSERRDELISEARNYAGTDLLSYRAPDPEEFVKRQSAAWDPWLAWADARGITLTTTNMLQAITQDADSLEAVAAYAADLPDFALTLYVHLVAVYGSAILAMAVMDTALDPADAFDLSRIDELYRAEIWGVDEDDERVRLALRQETATLGGLARFLKTR